MVVVVRGKCVRGSLGLRGDGLWKFMDGMEILCKGDGSDMSIWQRIVVC
jgi:hypothetical protein